MKRLWRFLFHNPNRNRNRVLFVSPEDRLMSQGYLVQYIVVETDKGKVLPSPVVMAMVEPIIGKSHATGKIHISLPASDIQIV